MAAFASILPLIALPTAGAAGASSTPATPEGAAGFAQALALVLTPTATATLTVGGQGEPPVVCPGVDEPEFEPVVCDPQGPTTWLSLSPPLTLPALPATPGTGESDATVGKTPLPPLAQPVSAFAISLSNEVQLATATAPAPSQAGSATGASAAGGIASAVSTTPLAPEGGGDPTPAPTWTGQSWTEALTRGGVQGLLTGGAEGIASFLSRAAAFTAAPALLIEATKPIYDPETNTLIYSSTGAGMAARPPQPPVRPLTPGLVALPQPTVQAAMSAPVASGPAPIDPPAPTTREPAATPAPAASMVAAASEASENVAMPIETPVRREIDGRVAKADTAVIREMSPVAAPVWMADDTSLARPPIADAQVSPVAVTSAGEAAPEIGEAAAPMSAEAKPEARPLEVAVSATSATSVSSTVTPATQATRETAVGLAAQMAQKLEGRTTRFEVALTPEGLGAVQVAIEIGRDGALSANFAFDRPHAAAELSARSGELRQALQQAGFDVGQTAFSFDGRQEGQAAPERQPQRTADPTHAFRPDDLSLADLPPPQRRVPRAGGLDVRV